MIVQTGQAVCDFDDNFPTWSMGALALHNVTCEYIQGKIPLSDCIKKSNEIINMQYLLGRERGVHVARRKVEEMMEEHAREHGAYDDSTNTWEFSENNELVDYTLSSVYDFLGKLLEEQTNSKQP